MVLEHNGVDRCCCIIPILPGTPQEKIDAIRRELDRVFLKQVLRNFTLEERINLTNSDCWRRYLLRIEILSSSKREQNAKHLKRKVILQELERRFLRALATSIGKKYRDLLEYQQVQHRKLRAGNLNAGLGQRDGPLSRRAHNMDDGNSSDEEAAGGREADAAEQRLHDRHLDDAAEYEGEEEDRVHVEKDDEEKQNDIQEEDEDSEKEREDLEEMEEEQKENAIQEKKKSADERVKQSFCVTCLLNQHSRDARPGDDVTFQFVISQSNLIVDYKFDVNSERWCEVVFQLPLGNKSKLDLATIVETEVEKFIVHQTPGIERCIESEEVVHDVPTKFLQTQGINLEVWTGFKRFIGSWERFGNYFATHC
ncbi:unnamed protein product [Strongylus vulgaris]|uniref:Uncharacterized protein n=1 Tax=Strongylus vulgaris TaxID=40348 RepID=A0A3P7I935_STRVU|nr:unnamed protein product [Strongylus vulgaris]